MEVEEEEEEAAGSKPDEG